MDESVRTARPESLVRAELLIAYVLRYGVLLCGAILALGIVVSLVRPGPADLFQSMRDGNDAVLAAATPRSLAAFRDGLAAMDANAVIALGLVLLIALPIVRVALTVVIFALEKDRAYLGITLFVLTVLLTGVVLGKIGG